MGDAFENEYEDARSSYVGRFSRSLVTHFYEAPEFAERLNAFEEAEAGSSATFRCVVRGFPVPSVSWYKDDERLGDDERYEYDCDDGVQSLTIARTRKTDEAAYKCRAENREGATSSTGYLSVTGDVSGKSLSAQQAAAAKSSEKSSEKSTVSSAPHLRTIVEQKTIEEAAEAAEAEMMQRREERPIQKFIDGAPQAKVPPDETPPRLSEDPSAADVDETSSTHTSVDSQDSSRLLDDVELSADVKLTERTSEREEFAEDNARERRRKRKLAAGLKRVPSAEAIPLFTVSISDEETERQAMQCGGVCTTERNGTTTTGERFESARTDAHAADTKLEANDGRIESPRRGEAARDAMTTEAHAGNSSKSRKTFETSKPEDCSRTSRRERFHNSNAAFGNIGRTLSCHDDGENPLRQIGWLPLVVTTLAFFALTFGVSVAKFVLYTALFAFVGFAFSSAASEVDSALVVCAGKEVDLTMSNGRLESFDAIT